MPKASAQRTNRPSSSKDQLQRPRSEKEVFEFVKKFVNECVQRRTVLPKIVDALKAAGFTVERGSIPKLLRKYPETFEYNQANQFVRLRSKKDLQEGEQLSFEERERRFINFALALLQEPIVPEGGLFVSWVVQLGMHPSAGINLDGLQKPTRLLSKHLDLFRIDGFGTAMVRVSLTEQGRLRGAPRLPREFRLYLRSDEVAMYRAGVYQGKKLEKREELEEKAKVLTDEELRVVIFLMRVVHAKGPDGTFLLHQAGVPLRKLGLTVKGQTPKLSNIVIRSQEVFDVQMWGTPYAEISLTQAGWEAAEKLPGIREGVAAAFSEGARFVSEDKKAVEQPGEENGGSVPD